MTDAKQTLKITTLVLSTYIFFAGHDTIAKILVLRGHEPIFVVWMRFFVMTFFCLALLQPWRHPEQYKMEFGGLHFSRSLLLVINTLLNFAALRYLQLAEAMSIMLSMPIIVALLSSPLLGERVTKQRWASAFFGFIGVLIVIRPGLGVIGWPALLSFGSACGFALYVIATRKMASSSTQSLLLYPNLLALVLLLPVILIVDKISIHLFDLLLFVSFGALGMFGQWCMISATKYVDASTLAPTMYTQLIWMTIFGWVVFSEIPDFWTFIGGGLIVLSGIYLWLNEIYTRRII